MILVRISGGTRDSWARESRSNEIVMLSQACPTLRYSSQLGTRQPGFSRGFSRRMGGGWQVNLCRPRYFRTANVKCKGNEKAGKSQTADSICQRAIIRSGLPREATVDRSRRRKILGGEDKLSMDGLDRDDCLPDFGGTLMPGIPGPSIITVVLTVLRWRMQNLKR
jgi:hypothetical protein